MTTQDKFISEAEQAELEAHRNARAANLFDVRRFIGGLFAIYGAILLVLGLGASDADVEKAAGVNVNLWTGLAMLIVAGIFLAWAFMRPLARELGEEEPDDDDDRGAEAAPAAVGADGAHGADGAAPTGSEPAGRRAWRDRERA